MFITIPKNQSLLNNNKYQRRQSQQQPVLNRVVRKTTTYFKRNNSKIMNQLQQNKTKLTKTRNSLHTTKNQAHILKTNQNQLLKSIRKTSYHHTMIVKEPSNSIKKIKQDNFLGHSNYKQNIGSKNSIYKANKNSMLQNSPQSNLQLKWQKVIQIYSMKDQLSKKYQKLTSQQIKYQYPIIPGYDFYKIFTKDKVYQRQWRINIPQTIMFDSDSNLVMFYTDTKGILKKKYIQKQLKQKDKYQQEVLNFKNNFIDELKIKNKLEIFKNIKIQQNPHIPLLILKYPDQKKNYFQTDVQTYRNFLQRKQKPTRQSIVQRYVHSNNLKAMVFRLIYRKNLRGQTIKPQFQGIKFQNQKNIFKQSTTSFPQTHKLTSTISLSQKRVGSIKFCKITNPRALQKFIILGKQLESLLQYTQKVIIDKLFIDFIVDVFQRPWVINIKYCQISPNSRIYLKPSQEQINSVGSCRLCGITSRKQDLKNSVSIRMLCEFISHLKKRTKNQDEHKIDFINYININSKQNKKSTVCKICYKIIIEQLQLMKMQKKLAQICNIIPKSTSEFMDTQSYYNNNNKNNINIAPYKQWRLLLYFQDIKHINQINSNNPNNLYNSSSKYNHNNNNKHIFNQPSPYILKYQLCPKITQSFKCKYQYQSNRNNLTINQLKLHYFYSENQNIQDFINNTEIIVSLYSLQSSNKQNKKNSLNCQNQRLILDSESNETLIASGSTHILSSFNLYKSSSSSLKVLMQNGQRQTATVLLFFHNKKYCQLTLKVGLVYDGSYNVKNIPQKGQNHSNLSNFVKWNQIWFSKEIWNSNPLPKQWMQIFGSNYNYNKIHQSISSSQDNNDKIQSTYLK